MYQEEIAAQTADHLRTHISGYLDRIASRHSDQITLLIPKSIEPASVVGGMVSELPNRLPAYGIDCLNKVSAGMEEDLFLFQYQGQINGMIAAGSQDLVDKLAKRHAAAIELFVREHVGLHKFTTDNFSFVEMDYIETEFSGAELVDESEDRQLWLGAFSINVFWFTSEDGPST